MGSPEPFEPFGAPTATVDGSGGEQFFPVVLPSGALYEVLTAEEAEFFEGKVQDYTQGFQFTNVSDLAELDRLVGLELLIHRFNRWIGRRKDYTGNVIDEGQLLTKVNAMTQNVLRIKTKLGIDKTTRDRQRGEGSVAQRWGTTVKRAGAFAVMRCQQAAKAIELANQLISLMDIRRNTDEWEKERIKFSDETILEWIDTVFREEFSAIRAHFGQNEMHYWHDGKGQY